MESTIMGYVRLEGVEVATWGVCTDDSPKIMGSLEGHSMEA